MSKRKSHLYNIYSKPLPINLSNLSIFNIIFGFNIRQDDIVIIYQDNIFKARDQSSVNSLWFNGFFGKGCLSRSEPSFAERTRRRLFPDLEGSKISSEEITKLRRLERLDFKNKRSELEKLENEYKILNDLDKLKEIEMAKNELTKNQKLKKPIDELVKEYREPAVIRSEDDIFMEDADLIDEFEYLQLLPSEVLFLAVINRVTIYDSDGLIPFPKLLNIIIPNFTKQSKQLLDFITYYHYKSLGWCIKSGVKFSTDFILYEKGPVFNHANFAILVMAPGTELDWIQLSSFNRVVSGVKKQLVLNYIEFDKEESIIELQDLLLNTIDDSLIRERFLKMLHGVKVNEFGINMWSSTRNRE